MADKKVTQLSALATPAGADLLHVIDDVAGTPVNKKMEIATLFANIPSVVALGGTPQTVSGAADVSYIKNTAPGGTATEFFISNTGESLFIRSDTGKNGIRLYADNDGADYEVVLYHLLKRFRQLTSANILFFELYPFSTFKFFLFTIARFHRKTNR